MSEQRYCLHLGTLLISSFFYFFPILAWCPRPFPITSLIHTNFAWIWPLFSHGFTHAIFHLNTTFSQVADKKKAQQKVRPKKAQSGLRNTEPSYKQQSISLFSSLKSENTANLGDVDFGHLLKSNVQNSDSSVYDPHSAFTSLKSSESNSDSINLGDIQSAYFPSSPKPLSAGSSERKIIDGLPGPPQDLKAPIVKGRFIILSWKPPLENGDSIQAYSIYYRQEGSDR